jgi:DNA-directed RNA polymerase subunit RPC12/RpoP
MMTQITCPSCRFRLSIPEGDMGQRQVCPNCRSPFFAGASVADPQPARTSGAAAPAPAYDKTMLGSSAPPIKYNCPRCQAPLEAPPSEAGLKKGCSSCGQRLQVPAAPPPPQAPQQPNLNKTMLAGDSRLPPAPPIKYNCPSCQKPLESPSNEAGTKKPCPACGQRLQIPAAPPPPMTHNPNKTILAGATNGSQAGGGQYGYPTPSAVGATPPAPAAAGQITIGSYTIPKSTFGLGVAAVCLLLFFLIVLLFVVVPAINHGGKVGDEAAIAAHQRELERAAADVEQKKAKLDELTRWQSDQMKKYDDLERETKNNYRDAMRNLTDQKQIAEMRDRQERDKEEQDRKKREMENEYQRKIAEANAATEKAKAAQQTVIQAAPPPVYYYPPYSWRYWWY